ncbi:copper ion chaperone, partial [Panaeolus papilionaceus]
SEHQYKFDVKMTCNGCSGAITRVLEKAKTNGDGVSSFEVSLDKQEVLVTGSIPYDDLLTKIKKTGKEVSTDYSDCSTISAGV